MWASCIYDQVAVSPATAGELEHLRIQGSCHTVQSMKVLREPFLMTENHDENYFFSMLHIVSHMLYSICGDT